MNQNSVIAIIAVIVILGILFLFLRGRSPASSSRAEPSAPSLAPDHGPAREGGVTGSAATAVEDITGQLIGLDVHPDLAGPPDDLTVIKGLGPKAAAQLKLLGITRYEQLAALDTAQIQALDQQMGVFRGRLERDRWIEQARHLARGDMAAFEQTFGKLGAK